MMKKYIERITTESNLSKQEAIWLLEHICKKKHLHVSVNTLTPGQEQLLTNYLNQIIHEHKPLAYIIGWIPFLDLQINVRPPVLIPRPETEEWVHQIIEKLSPYKDTIKKILDIGTGSGAIALSLAKSFPNAQIMATDINIEALTLAQENAVLNKIKNINFLKSNLFEKLEGQKFDLIVSNPPYIPENMNKTLAPSVMQWEDPQALFSGTEGLDILKTILQEGQSHLISNQGLSFQLVLEIDITQYESLKILTEKHDWNCSITKDLFGNWRTMWCTKNP